MKRLLFVLVLLMMTALTACNNIGSGLPSDEAGEAPKTTLELLESAGEKLRNADSFQMQLWHWISDRNVNTVTPYTFVAKEYWTVPIYDMQYTKDMGGSPAFNMVELQWESGLEKCVRKYYFHGNTGYSIAGWSLKDGEGQYDMHLLEDSSSESNEQYFWFLNNALSIHNDTLFESFCALEPTVSTLSDGSVSIETHLSFEQLQSMLGVNCPMSTVLEYERSSQWSIVDLYGTLKLSLEFIIDSQGYLGQIRLKGWAIYNETSKDGAVKYLRSLTFSQINEKLDITTPEVNNDNRNDNHDVFHHYDKNYQAHYSYNSERNIYEYDYIYIDCFPGASLSLDSDYRIYPNSHEISPTPYRLLQEIEGIPVEVGSAFPQYREQLIIPKGMVYVYGWKGGEGFGGRKKDCLFFEDIKKDANIVLINESSGTRGYLSLEETEELLGYIPYYDEYLSENIYYAGEWKYEDGVPTPIK